MALYKLDRNTIETGGFHGIIQKRLIVHPQYGPRMGVREGTWPGIGNLIYLADSWFEEGVATGLHPHNGIDVLTFVVEGQLDHEGSLEHGKTLKALDFQVQKSGQVGFRHNEVNTQTETCRMLQLWLIPEAVKQDAEFRVYPIGLGASTVVYGKEDGNRTQIEASNIAADKKGTLSSGLCYVVSGDIEIDGEIISEGTLIAANNLEFTTIRQSVLLQAYQL